MILFIRFIFFNFKKHIHILCKKKKRKIRVILQILWWTGFAGDKLWCYLKFRVQLQRKLSQGHGGNPPRPVGDYNEP